MTARPPDPLLEAEGVAKAYGPVVALQSVDFTVGRGEIHALLGANGAGKSTLVKILSGVVAADAGEVRIEGQPYQLRSPTESIEAGIATVFQDPALVPDLTVAQNVRLSRVPVDRMADWLERLGLDELDQTAMVSELPLETLRMLDLARAAAREPRILLLDELTAALPADHVERVFSMLAEWSANDRSAVLITHRLAEVMRVCDRATILRDGRDVERLAPRSVDEHQMIAAMLGDTVSSHGPGVEHRAVATDQPPSFEVRALSSGQQLSDVSFAVKPGEIVGMVALEGQGQDRLFDILAGERRPSGGEILVDGERRRFGSPADAVHQGVVLVPGDRLRALLPSLPVRHNLATPLLNTVRRWLRLPADEQTRVGDAVERLSMDIRAGSQVRRLSGGNQQKVAIGRWLVSGFRTLLCFDPTRGIDIQTKQEIYGLLRELAEAGAAIVLYTSELPEIGLVCDRVLIMHDGRIVDTQDAAEATETSMLTAAHGLPVSA